VIMSIDKASRGLASQPRFNRTQLSYQVVCVTCMRASPCETGWTYML
jgi:hypothetical protein